MGIGCVFFCVHVRDAKLKQRKLEREKFNEISQEKEKTFAFFYFFYFSILYKYNFTKLSYIIQN